MYVESLHVFSHLGSQCWSHDTAYWSYVALPQYMWASMQGRYEGNTPLPICVLYLDPFR